MSQNALNKARVRWFDFVCRLRDGVWRGSAWCRHRWCGLVHGHVLEADQALAAPETAARCQRCNAIWHHVPLRGGHLLGSLSTRLVLEDGVVKMPIFDCQGRNILTLEYQRFAAVRQGQDFLAQAQKLVRVVHRNDKPGAGPYRRPPEPAA